MNIQELIKNKIIVLDGAMGTMIQRYKFSEEDFRGNRFTNPSVNYKGNNDMLSITQPKAIEDIHFAYLEAGADIIETNTFSSNRISMADYQMENEVYDLNVESVKVAKKAIKRYHETYGFKPLFVAGALGPTNKTASISPQVNSPEYREVDFDFLASVYEEQATALIEAGADVLLVETIFDTLNAKAAFFGIETAFEKTEKTLPLMASGTITDASGRTLSGQTTEAFLTSLSHVPLLSIGLNCALGAEQLTPYLKALSNHSPFCVSAYPNAGLPNEMGYYDQSPQEMGKQITPFLEQKLVNIIGGCCGTTPEHIKEIATIAEKFSPRK